jgi:hypothetical protein
MKNNHLTDEILQTLLLNEVQDEIVDKHISECQVCKEKMKNYQFLFTSIKKVEPETFSFDVTSLVMEKIYEVEIKKEKNANIALYMCLSIILIIVFILLYPYVKTIFSQFKSSSIMANAFMMVSTLGVTIFLLKDIYRQYKRKEMLILQ